MLKRMFGPWRFHQSAGAADDTTPVVHALDVIAGFASGGDNVTITGLNFSGTPVVRFGSVLATNVVLVDRQTITCHNPAYGTTGAVLVSVTCGSQVGTLVTAFTYYTTDVTSVSPSYGTTMGSTRILLSGYNFVDGSVITVGGGFAQNAVLVDTEHYSFMTPAHVVGAGDIVITDPVGRITTVRNGFKWTTLGRGGDIRRSPGVTIRETLGNSPNTASFVVDGASNVPTEGEVVQIVDSQDSNRLLFAGFAQTVGEAYEGQPDQLAFQVSAVDFTPKLNRKRPVCSYMDQSATTVIIDLVTRFAPGFTTSHVQSGLSKVTVSFDGTKDFTTCLSEVCAAARAKWKVDYVKDIHAFTAASAVIKPAVQPYPSMVSSLTAYLTVAPANTIPGFSYPIGYYLFRHTFVWADGAESTPQSCADLVYGDGVGQFYFTDVPLGVDRPFAATASYLFLQKLTNFGDGDTVTIGSRIYTLQDTLTNVDGHVHIGGNLNETLDKLMFATQASGGVPGTDYAVATTANLGAVLGPFRASLDTRVCTAVTPGVAGNAIAVSAVTAAGDAAWWGEGTVPGDLLRLGADAGVIACTARRVYCGYLGAAGASLSALQPFCQVNDNVTTEFTTLFGQVGSGDALAVPISVTVPIPYIPFSSPYPAPLTVPVAVAVQSSLGSGRAWVQFRTAYLYRDGSWSWASAPTTSVGTETNSSLPLTGFSLTGIAPGSVVGGLDVVARLVYVCVGALVGTQETLFAGPDWQPANIVAGLFVVPDNVQTSLDIAWPLQTVGIGNVPRIDVAADPVVDLENVDPVGDLTDDNPDLLHSDSGSQGFTVTRDVSQVRNRIFIMGASTTVAVDCPEGNPVQGRVIPPMTPEEAAIIGDQFHPYYLQISDGSFLSAGGGMVRMRDAKTLKVTSWFCNGVYDAVPSGRSWIANLVTGHDIIIGWPGYGPVAAGSTISRFFQYDDPDSQAYMARIEPGTDGIYEYTIVDSSLVTNEQLRARALAEKEMYAWPIVTVRYATRDKRTAPGKTVHVNMTSPPCFGDFLIQDVQIDQIHDESDVLTPRYTVTASSMRMDLNDLLLALTTPQAKIVPHVPVLPQIFSVGVSALGTDYVKLTGTGFTPGTKVFFDGIESPDVVVE